MKHARRALLFAALFVILVMVLFPPWHIMVLGTDRGLGYAWLFRQPTGEWVTGAERIDMAFLAGQVVLVMSIAGIVWLLLQNDD